MERLPSKITAGRRIEMIFNRLDSLSTFPTVATQLLSKITSPEVLTQIVETDPALNAKILSVAHTQGLRFKDGRIKTSEIIGAIPAEVVREAALSIKVFKFNEAKSKPKWCQIQTNKQFTIHAIAVACCSRSIAEILLPQKDWELAFSAGLLHDIGKMALAEEMPKSFERIISEAEAQNLCSSVIERKYLGIDHAVLGKGIAERWHLPPEIVYTIWLHHSDKETFPGNMYVGRVAPLVHMADLIVRGARIGESGSYDLTEDAISREAESLSLSSGQIREIRRKLYDEVEQRSRLLGFDEQNSVAAYCDAVRNAAVKLSRDNNELRIKSRQLVSSSAHLSFVTDFLTNLSPDMNVVDIAETLALQWQKSYQTGPVCVYLIDESQDKFHEAVVIDEAGYSESLVLEPQEDSFVIPSDFKNDFIIMNASKGFSWLFEQLDVTFDLKKSKIAPLCTQGKSIGAIIFEQRYPTELENSLAGFAAVTSISAAIISLGMRCRQQTRLAERFAEFLNLAREAQNDTIKAEVLEGLAEMAAGAAHELNNPLAVISGRVQLLTKSEDDPEKYRILSQIRDRTKEISDIIVDLADYARPSTPVPGVQNVKILLEQVIKETAGQREIKAFDVRMEVDGRWEIFVDSKQIISALVKILSNALESYPDGEGPIRIFGACDETGKHIKLQITDFGYGMGSDVLQKATKPFFSDIPAGRKRGMGLAHAERIIYLNKGFLRLKSQLGSGTTATVLLPLK